MKKQRRRKLSFANRMETITFVPTKKKQKHDVLVFFKSILRRMHECLARQMLQFHPDSMKIQLTLCVRMEKIVYDSYSREVRTVVIEPSFNSTMHVALKRRNLTAVMSKAMTEVDSAMDAFVSSGSGWVVSRIEHMIVNAYRYKPFYGGSSTRQKTNGEHVRLPSTIQHKNACFNPKCRDDSCFLLATLAALQTNANPKFVPKVRGRGMPIDTRNELFDAHLSGWRTLPTPTPIDSIKSFEKKNKNLSFTVFELTDDLAINPIYFGVTNKDFEVKIFLLLYKGHYFLVRNLSRLLRGIYSSRKTKRFYCAVCLVSFASSEKHKLHENACRSSQTFSMPTAENAILSFTHERNVVFRPFVIFADFESTFSPSGASKIDTPSRRGRSRHRLLAFGAKRICHSSNSYNGKLVMKVSTSRGGVETLFFRYLEKELGAIRHLLMNKQQPLVMNASSRRDFKRANECFICKYSFKHGERRKCRDHDHLKKVKHGETNYRGAMCNRCNLSRCSLRDYATIPVIMHGLSNYDSHFLISFAHRANSRISNVVAKSSERFLTFRFGQFVFIDSAAHLHASLASLFDSLSRRGKEYTSLTRSGLLSSPDDPVGSELVCKKGVFPYSLLERGADYLSKTTRIPPKDAFYNALTDEHISQSEYDRAIQTWRYFRCKNLLHYLMIYLAVDTLSLADVFENYRSDAFRSYGLDPAYYITGPSFSFDAFLKMSGVELELFTEFDMYEMIRNSIRGGVSTITKRYSRSNLPAMGADYDPNSENVGIVSLDSNNLYGYALAQKLPYDHFRWLERDEIDAICWRSVDCEAAVGFFLEVDLLYPANLHSLLDHIQYPLAPEHIRLQTHLLSPHTLDSMARLGKTFSSQDRVTKLTPNFRNKHHYVCHAKILKFALKHGLELTKIHRVLSFHQTAFVKDFVRFNTHKRQTATSDFEKSHYKLVLNSLFGKFIENTQKRVDYKLIQSHAAYDKLIAQPTFVRAAKLNKHLIGVQMKKFRLALSKPTIVGATVLELSKLRMQEMFYDHLSPAFGEDMSLLMTDTDSFMVEIRGQADVHDRLSRLLGGQMDFSNFEESHRLHSKRNALVPGIFKLDYGSKYIREFCGLRSKMYSILILDEESASVQKAKGVKRTALKSFGHVDYLECLFQGREKRAKYDSIRSFGHRVYNVEEQKLALSAFDDKRWLLAPNGVYTVPLYSSR